jgi:hypothetical protein
MKQGAVISFRFVQTASFDVSSSSGLGHSAGVLRSVGRNVSLRHRKLGEISEPLSGHSLYHAHETSFGSSLSPNPTEKHASCHLCTLHVAEAPC